ncbi:MAG: transcriptional regulator [Methanosarcinaceae archaeon]|jgi:predicted transcriptional regulator|nr:transcriptional regulator [Methanosarcinaceae archaeon]
MIYEQITMMGDSEFEMVELLRKLNLTRPVALTLACLSNVDEITSRDIEMASGLRQPEVSIAMRHLNKYNWVDIREEKKSEGKGRPIKLYKLVVPLENVIKTIEDEIMAENKTILENIQRLKSFV